MRTLLCVGGVATMLILSSCGVGAGSGSGETDGALDQSIAQTESPYAVLDLTSGQIAYSTALGDLNTNVAYRDQKMVFKRVGPSTSSTLIGVFEITQAQWQRIAHTTPWTTVPITIVPASSIDPSKPAYNLTYDAVVTAIATVPLVNSARLSVPTSAQWELAAGGSTGWAWGTTVDSSRMQATAAVRETSGGTAGPRPVGSLAAAPSGVYDLHGNVWEWTAPGREIRGGSWFDSIWSARIDSKPSLNEGITSTINHALIGARLVLQP